MEHDKKAPLTEGGAAPTCTIQQANRTLAKFGAACRDLADENFRLGELAAQYVAEFLAVRPGKAQRSAAVERLAHEWLPHSEESTMPQQKAMKLMRSKVNRLLKCNAVTTLLGTGEGVAKDDSTKFGRGKKRKDSRLAWSVVRELTPLVYRVVDEFVENWYVLATVADKARAGGVLRVGQ